jgi:hypothetical protein
MSKYIEVRLGNPDAPFPYERFLRKLPLPESMKVNSVIADIERYLPPLYGVTEFPKMREIVPPEHPDVFRGINLFYKADRVKQEYEDKYLACMLPKTSEAISNLIGHPAVRWRKTLAIARKISDIPEIAAMIPIIHCRAKSNFSILRKMKRKNLDPEEIFDRLGIKIVVDSNDEAY